MGIACLSAVVRFKIIIFSLSGGVIAEVEGDEVAVEFDGRRACIPISSIRRANLVGRVDF